jgi:hypothetical protein
LLREHLLQNECSPGEHLAAIVCSKNVYFGIIHFGIVDYENVCSENVCFGIIRFEIIYFEIVDCENVSFEII